MDRRSFLATSVAALAVPIASHGSAAPRTLVASAFEQQIVPTKYAGPSAVWGFEGSVPGPLLTVPQGARLDVRLQNDLNIGTAIHWHGIRLPNAMDGVPGMTQGPVAPGEGFDYGFAPPDAGTYWYHSHFLSQRQVARGLLGPLIVTEPTPPDVDHDIPAVLTDWKFDPEAQLTEDFDNRHDLAHAGRMGNFATAHLPELVLQKGQRVRLRLINAAVDRIFPLAISGLDGRIVALDGMPLTTPRAFDQPMLAPAQRMDIIADVTGPVSIELVHRDGTYPLGALSLAQGDGIARRPDPIPTLPPNPVPAHADPARTLTLRMDGGAMGAGHGGDDIWGFNDQSHMPDQPFGRFQRGDTARIRLVNDTRWPHGIHLHGHHFHELDQDGTPGDFRDTTLVNPGQTRDILCTFDNPGRWMLHCHMLSHQTAGMKTWVEVT